VKKLLALTALAAMPTGCSGRTDVRSDVRERLDRVGPAPRA
jgi:hypothetical protein